MILNDLLIESLVTTLLPMHWFLFDHLFISFSYFKNTRFDLITPTIETKAFQNMTMKQCY